MREELRRKALVSIEADWILILLLIKTAICLEDVCDTLVVTDIPPHFLNGKDLG
jgi:hypothetical protein